MEEQMIKSRTALTKLFSILCTILPNQDQNLQHERVGISPLWVGDLESDQHQLYQTPGIHQQVSTPHHEDQMAQKPSGRELTRTP
jgi:hypothetical protein